MTDEAEWASSNLKIGYECTLADNEQNELVSLIEGYLTEAARIGIDIENAKTSLANELRDIAPVIEPFHRVLKRVLRNQRSYPTTV